MSRVGVTEGPTRSWEDLCKGVVPYGPCGKGWEGV